MLERINKIKKEALEKISAIKNGDELESLRVKYLGRKGLLKDLLGEIPGLPSDQRKEVGGAINELKNSLTASFKDFKNNLGDAVSSSKSKASPQQDVTLPGKSRPVGHRHLITQTFDQVAEISMRMGFNVADGPEIEMEEHNFDALNIPPEHPSRDGFDTFYLGDTNFLLRSHTSPVQIRYMKENKPPIRIIAPGRVFRPDAVDATHHYCFHQVEGLMVDEGVSFAHLKTVMTILLAEYFERDLETRFRPSFFPFTEPSAEVDISCIFCNRDGEPCPVCKGGGWIEIAGSGMVHPNVLEGVGINSEIYTGFAYGIGIERLAMLKHGVNDIRLFTENDVRFLHQF